MNIHGRRANLVAAHHGNRNALRHGVYSRDALDPKVAEVAEAIMDAPHVEAIDRAGAEEIARLIVLIAAMDAEITANGLTRRGDARSLVVTTTDL